MPFLLRAALSIGPTKSPAFRSLRSGAFVSREKWSAQANQPNPTSIELDQSFPDPRCATFGRSCVSKGRIDSVASCQPTLASLNPFDCLFLLDATSFSLGQIVIVPTQNRLDVFLEILTELSYLFFYALSCFGFRHSVLTCLSPKEPWAGCFPLCPDRIRRLPGQYLRRKDPEHFRVYVDRLHKPQSAQQ